ncbi:T9SS type A sorting domain-containing protein [Candidatus Latescibacterota bacterium]
MKNIIILIVLSLSFYAGADVSALEEGTWVHHERQAPTNDIQSIYSLPDGNIWVDTIIDSLHNFHVFDGEKWEKSSYRSSDFGENPPLISDSNGIFYFLNGNELVKWDYNSPNDTPQTFTPSGSGVLSYPMVAAISDENILYLASFNTNSNNGGLYRFDGTTIDKIRTNRVKSITVDLSGMVWITGNDSLGNMGLYSFENESWTDHTDEIDSALVLSDMVINTSPDSSIWITNRGKYGIYKEGVWSYNDGDSTGQISTGMPLTFDKTGKVWGYGNKDIYMLDDEGNWQISYEKDGISSTISGEYFLASDSESTIWIFDSMDIYKYSEELPVEDNGQWIEVRSNLDLGSNTVTSIAYTEEGYMVCGHGERNQDNTIKNAGISILIDSNWHNFDTRDGYIVKNVNDLVELEDGDILVYAGNSFFKFDGYNVNKVDSLFVKDGAKRIPYNMIVDDEGDLWIATDIGLMYHDFIDEAVIYSNRNFFNLFQASNNKFYIQSSDDKLNYRGNDGMLYSFDPEKKLVEQWNILFLGTIDSEALIRNFVAEIDEIDESETIFWIIQNNSLLNNRVKKTEWKEFTSSDTGESIVFKNASLLHMEEDDGLIWVSGYDNTGYLDNVEDPKDRVWHRIPELSGYASSVFKRSETGKIGLNALVVEQFGEYPTYDDDDIKKYYGVFEFTPGGTSIVSDETPKAFPVISNYPNPFNASTTLQFELPRSEHINISIYNMLGQHVKTLADGIYPTGTLNLVWDSKSDTGIPVSSGLYFYRVKTKNSGSTGKMLLLR